MRAQHLTVAFLLTALAVLVSITILYSYFESKKDVISELEFRESAERISSNLLIGSKSEGYE